MQKGEHHLLLVWLLLVNLVGFALFVALREKALLLLYLGDSSKLSWVITLMFVIITIYCARRVWFISVEINNSEKVCDLARRHELSVQGDELYLDNGEKLPDCLLSRYLLDLFYRAQAAPAAAEAAENNTINANNKELIEVFEAKLKNPHNLGWFFTDIMIKLGTAGHDHRFRAHARFRGERNGL